MLYSHYTAPASQICALTLMDLNMNKHPCKHTQIHTCIEAYMYACMHRHTYLWLCVCMHTNICTYIQTPLQFCHNACTHTYRTYIYMHIQTRLSTYIHKDIFRYSLTCLDWHGQRYNCICSANRTLVICRTYIQIIFHIHDLPIILNVHNIQNIKT